MDVDATTCGETVGRLARRFGLSRSALLYYHRIGLLVPSMGGDGRYRRYTQGAVDRLEQIVRYRAAGVPLADIRRILDRPADGLAAVLENRLEQLNVAIAGLREQQRVLVELLRSEGVHRSVGVMSCERWTGLLEAAGFTHDDMVRWHADFERSDPEAHREFLEFLCISKPEIEEIRAWAAKLGGGRRGAS
jgi:DNA-binding transcriptional MerR regulator